MDVQAVPTVAYTEPLLLLSPAHDIYNLLLALYFEPCMGLQRYTAFCFLLTQLLSPQSLSDGLHL